MGKIYSLKETTVIAKFDNKEEALETKKYLEWEEPESEYTIEEKDARCK